MKKARKPRLPKNLEGAGDVDTYYHICVMHHRLRLQTNANDVLYLDGIKEAKRIHAWIGKYIEWKRHNP